MPPDHARTFRGVLYAVLLLGGLLGLATLLAGCEPSIEELEGVAYSPVAGLDWATATPEAVGFDPLLIARLYYDAGRLDTIHSLLVVKEGILIAEDYFHEGSINRKDRLQSVTKSITGTLVGLAIDQGLLPGVDAKFLDYFPEVAGHVTDLRKTQITIRQLLEMRSGYPWEETSNQYWAGLLSGYYPPLIESFPLTADPGTRFQYSNLSSDWLGIIVSRVSDMTLMAFAQEQLFGPLGIDPGEWGTDAEGHNNGCGDLHLAARDMAKFGQLILQEGVWEGEEIVPGWWVRQSVRTITEGAWDDIGKFDDIGYGYHWWTAEAGSHHVTFAWGHGGQVIAIVEELDLVVVTTADPFWLEHNNESWKHEKAQLRLVSEFIASLP